MALMDNVWVPSEEIGLSKDTDIFNGTLPNKYPSVVRVHVLVHDDKSLRIMLVVSLTSVPSKRATDIRGTSVPLGAGVE